MKCDSYSKKVEPKEEIKIFTGGTVREELKKLLVQGYRPGMLKEVYELRKAGKIPHQWYDTGTVYFEGEVRDATLQELNNIKEMYENGASLLNLWGDFGLYGYRNMDNYGQFVGVLCISDSNESKIAAEPKKKRKGMK